MKSDENEYREWKQAFGKVLEDSEYLLVGLGEEWESRQLTETLQAAYKNLAALLAGREYFVVTTAMDGWIYQTDIEKSRIVAPCGNWNYMQCEKACCDEIWEKQTVQDGKCPRCGTALVENTVETKPYVESGYLPQWRTYMDWLQKSLNRKLVILELGVGFRTPTVIRWPFEKTAYLNQKASFFRIHENLFQLPEQLDGRGSAIRENSVSWILKEL